MRNKIFALVALLALSVMAFAQDWPMQRVLASVYRIESDSGEVNQRGEKVLYGCTGFAIWPNLLMTAGHCTEFNTVIINGWSATRMFYDKESGLAVLEVPNISVPYLKLGSRPKQGTRVITVGYGRYAPHPLFFFGLFQGDFDPWDRNRPYATYSATGMRGMSGGPIVNIKGEVVSVVGGGGEPWEDYQHLAFGSRYEAVRMMWHAATQRGK